MRAHWLAGSFACAQPPPFPSFSKGNPTTHLTPTSNLFPQKHQQELTPLCKNHPRQKLPFSFCLKRRALYGLMPLQTRTFREIWEPLVHMNFKGSSCGPIPCRAASLPLKKGPFISSKIFEFAVGPLTIKFCQKTSFGPWLGQCTRRSFHSWGIVPGCAPITLLPIPATTK